MNINSNNADTNGQTPENSNPPGQTPTTPHGQTPTGAKTPIETLPPDIQDYIRTLRSESESARKRLDGLERAKQKAEEQQLREQGQYKELAEQHESRVKELEPIQERYNALSLRIRAQVRAETKDWPPELKDLVPGEEVAAEEQLAAIEKLRPVLKKLQEQARGSVPGNRPDPKPSAMTPEQTRQEQLEKLRATGKYSNF